MENFVNLIPSILPIDISSPAGLFVFFLTFTFFLHILFVNLTLGGSLLLLTSKYISKVYDKKHYNTIAEELGYLNTFNISLTVTTGVAPLLFVQTIYGNFFYTSSILLSFKWLFVLVAVILAYYFYYLYKLKPLFLKNSGNKRILFIVLSAILFLYVAFMFVSNTLLSMHPEAWKDVYLGDRAFFDLPTLLPRYIHFVVAATAFCGLFLMVYAKFRKSFSTDLKETMYNFGRKSFFIMTLIQIPVGIWLLLTHEKQIMMLLMGKSTLGTLSFVIALAATIIALLSIALKKDSLNIIVLLGLVTTIFMVIVRRVIENGYFSQYQDIYSIQTNPQWSIFLIFVVLLLIVLIVMAYTLLRVNNELKRKQ